MKNKINFFLIIVTLFTFWTSCSNGTEVITKYKDKTYCAPVSFSSEKLENGNIKVTMKTETDDADIYYTINDTTPTTQSTIYSGPLIFSSDTTIKAVVVKNGIENSPVSSFKVTIIEKNYCSAVIFTSENLESGLIKVTMTTATDDAEIHYTTDGTFPTGASTKYSTPLFLTTDTTINAIAIKIGIENSPVSTVRVSIIENTIIEYIITPKTTHAAKKVLHMQQTTNGQSYILKEEDSKNIEKGIEISSIAKSYGGFTPMGMVQNEETITILYDRNIITYTFQTGNEGFLNDGTTEKKLKGLFGSPVSTPIVSSSTHNFGGWFTSLNEAPDSTFGETDLVFSVRWTPKGANVFNWYEIPIDVNTGTTATSLSKYVYFGVFPQTVLPSNSSVTIDESEIKIMGANTYYKGNDGNWYVKVLENCCVSEGYLYSDGTTAKQKNATSTRFFKVEPIKWKVLTNNFNGKCLLLAENILTANTPFYSYKSSSNNRSIENEINIHPNNYKHSQIRAYLNGLDFYYDESSTKTVKKEVYTDKGFLQTAFTPSAQLMISTTKVSNGVETTGNSEANNASYYYCDDTEDKIFLLSRSEMLNSNYGFSSKSSGTDFSRIRQTTDYAKANYANQSKTSGYGGYWWLRTPYYNKDVDSYSIDNNGNANQYIIVSDTYCGVVPALSISL